MSSVNLGPVLQTDLPLIWIGSPTKPSCNRRDRSWSFSIVALSLMNGCRYRPFAHMSSEQLIDNVSNVDRVGSIIKAATRWLFPRSCVLCGIKGVENSGICPSCLSWLPVATTPCPQCGRSATAGRTCGTCQKNPPSFDEVVSGALFKTPVDHLVREFKFSGKLYLTPILSTLVLRNLDIEADRPDLIVPVPLHASRIRERGYNQSAELARYLSRTLEIPCINYAVNRIRPTLPQTKLGEKQRRKNVRGAFALNQGVRKKHVVIVDDVMTTGSTVNEIARVLKRGGATKVSVWVIARTQGNKWVD